jgi:hypothetical protein
MEHPDSGQRGLYNSSHELPKTEELPGLEEDTQAAPAHTTGTMGRGEAVGLGDQVGVRRVHEDALGATVIGVPDEKWGEWPLPGQCPNTVRSSRSCRRPARARSTRRNWGTGYRLPGPTDLKPARRWSVAGEADIYSAAQCESTDVGSVPIQADAGHGADGWLVTKPLLRYNALLRRTLERADAVESEFIVR